jgi:hypothetical protein
MKIAAILPLIFASCVFAAPTYAQTNGSAAGQSAAPQAQTPAVLTGSSLKRVGFRLTDWKTIHSHSEQDAKVAISTLTKIGCEVTSDNHGNHIDVRYRCPEWKSMKVSTDQLANQWSTWCAGKGMETVVLNPPANTKNATVKFRLPNEKSIHLHDPIQAQQILNTLKMIGCTVSTSAHGNHIDASFSCPEWITIELPSDDNAHSWQKWLKESGFETQHVH